MITQNTLNFISKKIKKKVIGKFKDETAGKPIIEFVGLKSKMYSYKKEDLKKNGMKIYDIKINS